MQQQTFPSKTGRSLFSTPPALDLHQVAMATTAPAVEEEKTYGFEREDMYSLKLENSVDSYSRHVFLCYKSPNEWESRVEDSDEHPLPKLLAAKIKSRQNDFASKTKLTVCSAVEGQFSDGDVLVFPQMVVYRDLKESDVDAFVDNVLWNGKPWASGVQDPLKGSFVFVCSHASRDKRCGVCGPVLIQTFKDGIESRGLTDLIFVSACSHVGGHKYAGNLIIFSRDLNEIHHKPMGHWYGYVTPNDVPILIDDHIVKGQLVPRIWRGQMEDLKKEEKSEEQKIPNGQDQIQSEQYQEAQGGQENVTGCCQGANGSSCCKDEILELKGGSEVKVQENKGSGKLSCWKGKWEQSDVYMAAGIVGAVATIAVAYIFFKRSG